MKIGNVLDSLMRAGIGTQATNKNKPCWSKHAEINNDTKSVDAMKVWL
jgi:hypothetical protein